jgi:hypothetical protein
MAEGNNLQLRVATSPAITDSNPLGTSTFPGKSHFGFWILDYESPNLDEFPSWSLKFESGLACITPMRHWPLVLGCPYHAPKRTKHDNHPEKTD